MWYHFHWWDSLLDTTESSDSASNHNNRQNNFYLSSFNRSKIQTHQTVTINFFSDCWWMTFCRIHDKLYQLINQLIRAKSDTCLFLVDLHLSRWVGSVLVIVAPSYDFHCNIACQSSYYTWHKMASAISFSEVFHFIGRTILALTVSNSGYNWLTSHYWVLSTIFSM